MSKQAPSREQDKFIVRLPNGMRDRIKAKADRAKISMNEAIVWCLEQHFPAAATLDERLDELAEMVAILGQGEEIRPRVERLVDEIQTTLDKIATDKIPVGSNFQSAVRDRLERWAIERARDWQAEHDSPFEDDGAEIVRGVLRGEPKD